MPQIEKQWLTWSQEKLEKALEDGDVQNLEKKGALKIDKKTAEPMHRLANTLQQIPAPRLFEECLKLFLNGHASENYKLLDKYNFTKTKVNSRTLNREDQYLQYGWGQTTPKEMSKLMIEIKNGNIVSKKSSDEMYRHLTRIYWDDEALSQIPNHIQVASKQGAINKSRSEVVLVNSPSGDYVFCIITNNQSDESWSFENEGFVLIRKISRLLWNYYQ